MSDKYDWRRLGYVKLVFGIFADLKTCRTGDLIFLEAVKMELSLNQPNPLRLVRFIALSEDGKQAKFLLLDSNVEEEKGNSFLISIPVTLSDQFKVGWLPKVFFFGEAVGQRNIAFYKKNSNCPNAESYHATNRRAQGVS